MEQYRSIMNDMEMTKFGKFGKTGLSGFLFRIIRFWKFQGKTKEGVKLKDLKIQGVLMHEKLLKGIKEPRWKKSKPKAEIAKIGLSVFSITDKVRVGFEI
jgi:hypothetical protein